MRLNELNVWEEFVYKLLYPGILGSMIYGESQILRGVGFNFFWYYITKWSNITPLLIVSLFIINYFHMYNDLHRRDKFKHSKWWFIADGLIALGFCAVYWSMSYKYLMRAYMNLGIIFFLILIYPAPYDVHKITYFLGKLVVFIIALTCIFVSRSFKFMQWKYTTILLGLLAVAYLVQVIYITEIARAKHKQIIS